MPCNHDWTKALWFSRLLYHFEKWVPAFQRLSSVPSHFYLFHCFQELGYAPMHASSIFQFHLFLILKREYHLQLHGFLANTFSNIIFIKEPFNRKPFNIIFFWVVLYFFGTSLLGVLLNRLFIWPLQSVLHTGLRAYTSLHVPLFWLGQQQFFGPYGCALMKSWLTGKKFIHAYRC